MRIRIRDLYDPGSETEKIRIRDKHPGSATLARTRTEEEGWPPCLAP
jgi:hypothetical protein